jgi:SAM-dependent methyltransferase
MMFDLGESFDYTECAHCGAIQINRLPDSMERYYPEDYYARRPVVFRHEATWRRLAKRLRLRARRGDFGKGAANIFRQRGAPYYALWLERTGVAADAAILDFGCGSGRLLADLWNEGYRDLTGIDPYIEAERRHGSEIRIIKGGLEQIDREFDLIMLHHSFEHLPDPLRAMRQLCRFLRPEGVLFIRTPVASSWAHRHYGVHWAQWDAPRHCHLQTSASMEILAGKCGCVIVDSWCDSTELQFYGSEQNKRNIALAAPMSYAMNRKSSLFSPHEIDSFRHRAEELNAAMDGDQACFIIRKTRVDEIGFPLDKALRSP